MSIFGDEEDFALPYTPKGGMGGIGRANRVGSRGILSGRVRCSILGILSVYGNN